MVRARPGGRNGCGAGRGDSGEESILSREEVEGVDVTEGLVDGTEDISEGRDSKDKK
jgi:hypothetical protein